MPNHPYPSPPPPTNNLGVAGFVVSLIGLISCGLLSPIGLVMSFIAMQRQSDGLSIAGFVMGLLGSLWIIIALVFGLFTAILAALGLAAAASGAGGPTP